MLALVALIGAASAAELHTVHQLGVAMFPAGVQYIFEAEERVPLGHSQHVLLRGSNVAFVAHAELTPSFPRVGPVLRIAPVAFWDVTLRADATWYWGAFSSILPFDDPGFEATAANKQSIVEAGGRRAGWGVRFDAETRLKGKVGPVIALLELQYRHHHVEIPGQDFEWFWEPTEMLNVPADGDVINRNAYVFAQLEAEEGTPGEGKRLWLGAVGMWQTCPQSGDRNIRLGPVLMWRPTSQPAMPTFIAGGQAWLESRFVPTLPPYTFLAVNWAR